MKKTFTFFAISALFLMLLFPVSVKADTTLSFIFEDPNGGPDEDCNGNTINDWNAITTSDFHFSSKLYEEVKKQSSYLDKSWTSFKAGAKACTRHDVYLEAGSYTFTLKTTWMYGNNNTRVPIIRVNSQDYSLNNVNYPSNEEVDLEYTVSISSTNDYPILITCVDGDADKFCMRTLTITPNCTQHTVTVAADDNNKGTVAGGGSYCENSEVTVTATPNPGYNFVNWTDNNNSNAVVSTNASYTFTLTANVSYRANFAACEGAAVTVNVNNGDMGSATGEGSYCAGAQVDLEAIPESGYRFVNWTVTSGSADINDVNSASAHFTMSNPAAAVTVQANFELDPCTNTKTIQCEDYDPEITKPSVGHAKPGNYQVQGERISGSDEGYGAAYGDAFASFRDSGNDKEIFYNIYLPAATYTFTVRCANGGLKKVVLYNAAGDEKLQELELGNEWTNNSWYNYTTSSWTASSSDNYYIGLRAEGNWAVFDQITITANSNVFCPNTITMQKSGDASAADPTSSPANAAMAGTEVTITAGEASANHYFSGWTVSPENAVTFADQTNATTTFVMPAEDVTITANYGEVVSSALTFAAGEGGSITSATAGGNAISSGAEVISGTSVTLTAEANSNYVFINWTDNNNSDEVVSTNAEFTFSMPATATSYTANFAQIDNVISQGSETGSSTYSSGATMEESHINDFGTFGHSVLKLSYSDMTGGNYYGWNIGKSDSYDPASSAGATGFGFYYKTETNADKVAFCFDHGDSYNQYKVELPATNNVWKYHYFDQSAANGWNGSNIIIYINGKDGDNETANASGAIYIADIAATTITSKDDIANYHYTNNRDGAMAVNDYGTLCLPMDGTISGATLYSVAGKETGDISYLVLEDKGTSVEAGKPYITQSTATSYTVTMNGPHIAVQDGNGLVGTYETIDLTPYAEPGTLNYFLYENTFKKAGDNVTVGAYRAYLNWDAVGAVTPAPSARRIRMVIEGKEVETGMETVTAMPKTTKVLIDGQLFIIREGKRYTLTGARAQ